MTLYVVYTDSNPQEVQAFFAVEAQAVAWRDANFPAADVQRAEVDEYRRITAQTISLP